MKDVLLFIWGLITFVACLAGIAMIVDPMHFYTEDHKALLRWASEQGYAKYELNAESGDVEWSVDLRALALLTLEQEEEQTFSLTNTRVRYGDMVGGGVVFSISGTSRADTFLTVDPNGDVSKWVWKAGSWVHVKSWIGADILQVKKIIEGQEE